VNSHPANIPRRLVASLRVSRPLLILQPSNACKNVWFALAANGAVRSAHDISDGGIAAFAAVQPRHSCRRFSAARSNSGRLTRNDATNRLGNIRWMRLHAARQVAVQHAALQTPGPATIKPNQ